MSDPTEDLREDFLREMRRRWRSVRQAVRDWILDEDIFGLAEDGQAATTASGLPDDAPPVFRFQTDRQRTAAFLEWLRGRFDDDVLEPLSRRQVRQGQHWTAQHVRAAVDQGWRQARSRLRTRGVQVGSLPGDDEMPLVEAVFNLPAPRRALQEVYTRSYDNLQSIGADAADPVRQTLLTGLENGWGPDRMAARLGKELQTIQRTQAEVLARTETVNAYTEATIARYRRAGVGAVQHGEWSDSGDARVCPICESLDGREIPLSTINEATFTFDPGPDEPDHLADEYPAKPPAHAGGRCASTPRRCVWNKHHQLERGRQKQLQPLEGASGTFRPPR